jgi:hypothetical protein
VGWGDEPQICDAKLEIDCSPRTGETADEQYEEWKKDWDHKLEMVRKWEHYTHIAANYLIHYHSQCNGADYGGRAQLIFRVQSLELDQVVYGHEHTYTKEMPQKIMGLVDEA